MAGPMDIVELEVRGGAMIWSRGRGERWYGVTGCDNKGTGGGGGSDAEKGLVVTHVV